MVIKTTCIKKEIENLFIADDCPCETCSHQKAIIIKSSKSNCQFCGNNFHNYHKKWSISGHHQYPKQFRNRKNFVDDMVYIHNSCENFIHENWDNKILKSWYEKGIRISNILEHEEVPENVKVSLTNFKVYQRKQFEREFDSALV